MSTNLLDVLSPSEDQGTSGKYYGVVVGIVTNNQDPEKMARVRVKFPWLNDDNESWWARMAVPMAGGGRGSYFLPEVDDEVLVSFEHGDVRSPYIVGSLWNGKDAPPADNGDGKNNRRLIHSRSGHVVCLDDTQGDEKIEVIDKTSGNKITIKSSDNSISLECTGDMNLTCKGKMTLHATTGLEITSDATMDIKSNANMTIKGAMIAIN